MHIAGTCSHQTRVRAGVCYCVYDAAEGWLTPWMGNFTYAIRFRSLIHLSLLPLFVRWPIRRRPFSSYNPRRCTGSRYVVGRRSTQFTSSWQCPVVNPPCRHGRSCTSPLPTTTQTPNPSPHSPSFPTHLRSHRTHIQCPQDPRFDILPRQVHRRFTRADRGRVCRWHRGCTAAARSLRTRARGLRAWEHKE